MAWWALPPAPRWDCRAAETRPLFNVGGWERRRIQACYGPLGLPPGAPGPEGASKLLLQFHVKLCNLSTWRHALEDGEDASEVAFGCRH